MFINLFYRKLFNLSKEDNVCQYVIKRPLPAKDGKKQKYKAPSDQSVVKIPRKLKEAEIDGQYWGCSYAAKRLECFHMWSFKLDS